MGSDRQAAGLPEKQSLDDFLRSVQGRALTTARLSVPDEDALDCVQAAMLAFVRKYPRRPAEEWRPLFFRILYNQLRDWHRRRAVREAVTWVRGAEERVAAPEPEPDRWLAVDQAGRRLLSELARLPLRQQQAFILRHWEGMDTAAVAAAMGVRGGSVKTHLSRAIRRLRQALENYHEPI